MRCNSLFFNSLVDGMSWARHACEGMDGGEFVGELLVAVERYVLVGVGGFAIDNKV